MAIGINGKGMLPERELARGATVKIKYQTVWKTSPVLCEDGRLHPVPQGGHTQGNKKGH